MALSAYEDDPGAAALLRQWRRMEHAFQPAFGDANPWHHLGSLGFYLFWVVAVTGIYVYAVFDTSVTGAWRSVQSITVEQWYLGGVMRSLHRYASDGFVLLVGLHLLKELVTGHFQGFRWFSWVTGIPLVWLAYASGIGGYWLVWDQLAQFSIVATAEWLAWLPLGGEAIIRNFTTELDDRFFSLLIFLHIGIPLLLLAGMWLHIQRISRARTFPPRSLATGTFLALLAAAIIRPATSHPPADPSAVAATLQLDWFYLFVHPLQYATSPGALWAFTGSATLLLAAMPLFARRARAPVAVVSPDSCNGCGRCFEDCPYAAVVLQPRPEGRGMLATVLPDLCASCGICAGACPSSTPFRSSEHIVTGIDLPNQPIDRLRDELDGALAALTGATRIVVFGCRHGARVEPLRSADTAAMSLECTGMLAPSFVEYAIRAGAQGILVTGCGPGNCEYRLGTDWTEERISGAREPHLRANVARTKVHIAWRGAGEETALQDDLRRFRASLRAEGHADAPQRRHREARTHG